MRRILIVDDERPVVEGMSLIIRRELSDEFEVVGTASSGRSAIEKAAELKPDIILMDVRMPGISGLDAIREIRNRGAAAAFILVTAYERFDIAREAVELGVVGYLLKPVSKERLAPALHAASAFLARRSELENGDIDRRERDEAFRAFAETALLQTIMLGERPGPELAACREALGIDEPFALVVAVAFLPAAGTPDPEKAARALHEKLRAILRYKTEALAGPFVRGRSLVLLPLKDEHAAEGAVFSLMEAAKQGHQGELARGEIRFGIGSPKPLAEARASWTEALRDLLGSRLRESGDAREIQEKEAWRGAESPPPKPFETDEIFLDELLQGETVRAGLSLDLILEPLRDLARVAPADRYRLVSLFGAAYRALSRRGLLARPAVLSLMDLSDLATTEEGPLFEAAVRARYAALSELARETPRLSLPVARAIAFIKDCYGRQIGLEAAAESVGLSPNRLSRLFVEEIGRGFSDYLIEYRIGKAKEFLAIPGAAVKQVSASCGYPDPNYFSRLFKKVTGLTPSTFALGATEDEDEEDQERT